MFDVTTHVTNGFLKLFTFSGRATRAEFWTFYTTNLMTLLVCLVLANLASDGAAISLSIVGILAVTFGNLASAARRLHDTNRSGWWLASTVLPFMPFVVMFFMLQPSVSGPTRFDDDGGMPERTPDHFTRAQEQRPA